MERKIISLGKVQVDTGTLVIADPCNISELNYSGCIDREEDYGTEVNDGEAVIFETGFGDGFYEVFAEVKDYGKAGKRVSKIWIDFITEDE